MKRHREVTQRWRQPSLELRAWYASSCSMEEISQRIQNAVEGLVDDIDQTVSRPQQQAAYKCCNECFSDKSSKREWVQRCIEACHTKVQRTEAVIQGELSQFQERLQRCALRCQDHVRSNYDPSKENSSIDSSREVEKCVMVCVEEHINSLPSMASRIKHQAK